MYAIRKPERPNLLLQLLEDRRAAADDRQVQVWPIRHERGDGLDEMAVKLVKTKCKFGAARNKAGKNVPFVITYFVTWKIE